MFKNMRLVILFDILLNTSFKMTTRFANIARTAASTSKCIYQEILQIIRNSVFIWKKKKRNGVVILDQKRYNNAIEEIISDTSQFEKLSEDPTYQGEALLQPFLRKLKQKNFLNQIEYDKLYHSGSAPARIYGRNATMYGCNVELQPSMAISVGRNTMIYACNVLVIFKYNIQGSI